MFTLTEFRDLTTVESLIHKRDQYLKCGDLIEASNLAYDICKILRDNYPVAASDWSFDDALLHIDMLEKMAVEAVPGG